MSITIIQIFKHTGEENDYKDVIQGNSDFCQSLNLEYIVYDTLSDYQILRFIKEMGQVKYFRNTFKSTKASMLESGLLASGEKIIYLKNLDVLSLENAEILERQRPNILKKNLNKLAKLKNENFKYDNFNLLMKENKTLWEKLKLLFN